MTTRARLLLLTLVPVITLAGCADVGERQRGGSIMGAMLGGVGGAMAGGDDALGTAVVGAAAGAIAGGAIGAALDAQAEDLRSSLENDGIIVTNTGEALIVTMPNGLLFAVDSATVMPAIQRDLGALARNLIDYPDSNVIVTGHTDNTGSDAYNQTLSERRAQSVTNILAADGVAPARLRSVGRGETQPVATNETEAGRAQNRRVEVIIRPFS